MKELVLKSFAQKEIFMAALLLATSAFSDAQVRLLKEGEDESQVNVTQDQVLKLCPTWASSTLIANLIRYKVFAAIIDQTDASIDQIVRKVKSSLEKISKEEGIEMPV